MLPEKANLSRIESVDSQGSAAMLLDELIRNRNLDLNAEHTAKLAFQITRLALGHPADDDPRLPMAAERTVEIAASGERNADLVAERVLAEVREKYLAGSLSHGELLARSFRRWVRR
jgi:hypothetical protein